MARENVHGQRLRLEPFWPTAAEEGEGRRRRGPFRARAAGEEGLAWLQRRVSGAGEMAKSGAWLRRWLWLLAL